MLNRFRLWLRTVFLRRRLEREMQEEMAEHLARATERFVARGLSPEEARRAARREFGNVDYIQEQSREARGARWVESLFADLRYAARTLRRSPVFTLVVVLSIGFAIGANTAVFGVIHSLLLERLPIARPNELVAVQRFPASRFSPPGHTPTQFEALTASSAVPLTAFGGIPVGGVEIDGVPAQPIQGRNIGVHVVDGAFFDLLEIAPAAGRLLSPSDDESASPVVVTSFGFALRNFGSAGAAVGRAIALDGHAFTVVGVTPKQYRGIVIGDAWEIAIPRGAMRILEARFNQFAPPNMRWSDFSYLHVIARVREDVLGAEVAVERIYQQCCSGSLSAPDVQEVEGQRIILADVSRGMPAEKGNVREDYSQALFALMGGVAVLLLIACTNVGNLLLARGVARSRELAVRLSLGASRARVTRQLMVESMLLAVMGAALGSVLAWWGTGLAADHLPANMRQLEQFVALRPSAVIFTFTVVVAAICALLFGVLPAVRATRRELIACMREGRAPTTRFGLDRALVALQVGLALVLTSAAGLLVATLVNLSSETPGLDPARLLIADIRVRGTPHADEPQRQFFDAIQERISSVPGVSAVAGADVVPLLFIGGGSQRALDMPGVDSDNEQDWPQIVHVTPGYFEVSGIALESGRDFGPEDQPGSERTAIVSRSFATRFLAGRDPIGEIVRFKSDETPIRVVGVAEEVKWFDLRAPAPRTVYLAGAQESDETLIPSLFVMRTDGGPAAASAVRSAIQGLAPGVDVRVQYQTNATSYLTRRERSLAWLAGIFSVVAVLLAAIGLYGVLAFQVSARTGEIGIRIALGANRTRVVGMVLRQSLVLVGAGVLLGVPLTLAAAKTLSALLYGVDAWDPGPLSVAVLVLGSVGVLASLLPARRAARVDPLLAIRAE